MENLPCTRHKNQCLYTDHLICFRRACVSGSLIIILLMSKLTLRMLNRCPLVRKPRTRTHLTSVVLHSRVLGYRTQCSKQQSFTQELQEHGWRSPMGRRLCDAQKHMLQVHRSQLQVWWHHHLRSLKVTTGVTCAQAWKRQMKQSRAFPLQVPCQGPMADAHCGIPKVPTFISGIIMLLVMENKIWKKQRISNLF